MIPSSRLAIIARSSLLRPLPRSMLSERAYAYTYAAQNDEHGAALGRISSR
jgi:hypothetical protein